MTGLLSKITDFIFSDKAETALIAIQTAKIRSLEIEDYRIILPINGYYQMQIPIY